jgi:ribosomal protein S27E
MKYKVKGLAGSTPTVSFRCEHCHGGLVASLEEAGQATECPSCGTTIAVPAGAELAEWKRHRTDQERAAKKKQAERMASRKAKQAKHQAAASDGGAQQDPRQEAKKATTTGSNISSVATPTSFADRVLLAAFGFFRGISMLLVCVAALAIAGGVVWLVLSLPTRDLPPEPGEVAEIPNASGFIAYCKQLEIDAKRQAEKGAGGFGVRGQPQQPPSSIQQFQWPCSQVADEVRQVITAMDLDPDAGREFLCEWYGDLPATDRKQSWEGLVIFVAEYQSQRKKLGEKTKEWCDSGAAVMWYIEWDERNRRGASSIEIDRHLLNEERAAQRKWSIDTAGMVIASAIVLLMAFIALPLLIQIERNTRATLEISRKPR